LTSHSNISLLTPLRYACEGPTPYKFNPPPKAQRSFIVLFLLALCYEATGAFPPPLYNDVSSPFPPTTGPHRPSQGKIFFIRQFRNLHSSRGALRHEASDLPSGVPDSPPSAFKRSGDIGISCASFRQDVLVQGPISSISYLSTCFPSSSLILNHVLGWFPLHILNCLLYLDPKRCRASSADSPVP